MYSSPFHMKYYLFDTIAAERYYQIFNLYVFIRVDKLNCKLHWRICYKYLL